MFVLDVDLWEESDSCAHVRELQLVLSADTPAYLRGSLSSFPYILNPEACTSSTCLMDRIEISNLKPGLIYLLCHLIILTSS
jgi:hypothetical protein